VVVTCPRCGSDQITANKQGANVKNAVIGAVLLGPLGLAFGAAGRNKMIVTCLACGNSWQAGQFLTLADHPNGNKYPEQVNGFRYRTERGGQVAAITPTGEEVVYRNWKDFWKAAGKA
jgi:ribosomal protein S27E